MNHMIDGDDGSHPFSPRHVPTGIKCEKCGDNDCEDLQEVNYCEYSDDEETEEKSIMVCADCAYKMSKDSKIVTW